MKIAVLGGGFSGLAACYHLLKKGHQVTVFEKESSPGGLAIGFKEKDWAWPLEKHYHHFFTNDNEIINLAKELDLSHSLIFPSSLTSLFYQNKIYPFNSPLDILGFPPLSLFARLRLGLGSVFLKLLPAFVGQKLEAFSAWGVAEKIYGHKTFQLIWQPLLEKKFGSYVKLVNASWFWARIKKRTLKLGYVEGGFQTIADALAQKIQALGGKIFFDTTIQQIKNKGGKWVLQIAGSPVNFRGVGTFSFMNVLDAAENLSGRPQQFAKEGPVFDAIISTLPTPIFTKLVPNLPKSYVKTLNSIPHLHALNLVLELKEPLLKNTYWLNINEPSFPFLCVVQHTNFIDKKYYGGNHILYVSNYLPSDHSYFKKTARELLSIYLPYLKKINPRFEFNPPTGGKNLKLFVGPFAQPVFLKNYSQIRPFGKIPLANLYFANLDSVYPWDRGTNYALEVGRKISELIT
ncbi:FAD-dependent oxidoreductase [Candidatus Gottesmanbacteria bacterium]|nr:FAD-dependent oxidoreductase [Candidatus Gottesmanbacteria bacterium]